MTEPTTTTATPDRAEPLVLLDSSAEAVDLFLRGLPKELHELAGEIRADARRLAALGTQAVERYHRFATAIDALVPEERVQNGGELVNALMAALGVADVQAVLATVANDCTSGSDGPFDGELVERLAQEA